MGASLALVSDRTSGLPASLGWRAGGERGSPVALTLLTCSLSLFPTMPRHNLHKIAPLVKSLCAKHGIEYQEKPLLRALLDIVR